MRTKGTLEWADSNINCYYGCSNDCVYCYSKRMALQYGRIKLEDQWKKMIPNEKAINKQYRKREGRIMFPTSHDITEYSYDNCIIVLKKLLKVGNEILITTKPNDDLMFDLMETLDNWKKQVLFRFTITSFDDDLLKKYEPNAPDYESRYMSIYNAFENGWKTSISIEPFLDKDPTYLITRFFDMDDGGVDIITDTIWLGVMSGIVPEELKVNYTKENLVLITNKIKKLPGKIRSKIRFKDSICNLLHLESNRIIEV